jgi:L-lactate utilization protein LutC
VEREAFIEGLRRTLASAPALAGAHPPPDPPAAVPRVAWRPDSRPLEERFAESLAGVRGRLTDQSGLEEVLAELEVRTAVFTTDALELPESVQRLELDRAREADAGVTEALAACAATGTVVLSASPEEPRGASLLPRVHVVAVRREALVDTPGDFMRTVSAPPSALTFVTGPSRTADIEGELVFGVHGPRALAVVLV